MKSFCSLLFVIYIITTVGCRKDKQAEPETKESCRIESVNPTSGSSCVLTYDDQNRIITIAHGMVRYEYTYDGNLVTINRKINGNLSGYRSIYSINAEGLPVGQTLKHYSTGEWMNQIFEYEDGKIKKITANFSDGRPLQYTEFTWVNGNLESKTELSHTAYYEYYTDQPADVDFFDIDRVFYDPGIKYIVNRNRVKSRYYEGALQRYSYITDAQGRVKTVRLEAGPNTTLFDLQLLCK